MGFPPSAGLSVRRLVGIGGYLPGLPGASCGISAGRAVARTGKTDGIGAGTLWCGLGSTSSRPNGSSRLTTW
jgi:hypothetical protein